MKEHLLVPQSVKLLKHVWFVSYLMDIGGLISISYSGCTWKKVKYSCCRDRCWRSTEESGKDPRCRLSLFTLDSYLRVLLSKYSIQFAHSVVHLELFLWRPGLNSLDVFVKKIDHNIPVYRVTGKHQMWENTACDKYGVTAGCSLQSGGS